MKKSKELEPDCSYVLYPLGKGLPFCSYEIIKEHRLAEVKLSDFPPCDPKHCPMKKEKEKNHEYLSSTP